MRLFHSFLSISAPQFRVFSKPTGKTIYLQLRGKERSRNRILWSHLEMELGTPTEGLALTDRIMIYKTASPRCKRFRLVSEQNGIFGFGRARNGTRANFLSNPLPALLLVPFFARSLTLVPRSSFPVPRSLLRNRTETLATQAIKQHTFLHESAEFRSHEASESFHQNCIFLKPFFRAVSRRVHTDPD